jgi:hypothetical protein
LKLISLLRVDKSNNFWRSLFNSRRATLAAGDAAIRESGKGDITVYIAYHYRYYEILEELWKKSNRLTLFSS